MAPLGGFALAAIVSLASLASNTIPNASLFDLLDLSVQPVVATAVLAFGLLALAAALRFDMSDPYRVSRRSAAGFWLHIVAAPAIVNTLCLTAYNMGGTVGVAATLLAFALVAALAVVIDRRSFLMAGAVYFGVTIASGLEAVGGDGWQNASLAALILGAAIAVLGAKWTAVRARVMRALPAFPGKDRLPPY